MLNPTAVVVELKPGGIDMAIRYRDRRGLDAAVETVLVADMVMVGTPELIGQNKIADPAMLMDVPWLQELGTNEVADWMARHGVTLERPLIITHMPGNLIMDAVRRGDGITYTARPWVASELQSGQLIEIFTEKSFGIYYMETRPGILRSPEKAFIKRLKHQAANETAS
jgi:DNA-binding transcriptional LysR family regulator